MSYQKDLVSVVMPTYHDTQYLERAVDSVLNQTYKDIECILVNDNTPGDEYSQKLYAVIEKYKDKRFVFLEQEKHINGAAARNFGIRHAHGEFIAFLDADDWWKPEKVEKQVRFMRETGCAGSSTLVEYYDEDTAVRWMRPYKDGKIAKQILRREVDVNTGTFMAKHTALDKAGYFDESLKRHQEVQLLTMFTSKYSIRLLPEYLTCYNTSSNNNMPNPDNFRRMKEALYHSVSSVMDRMGRREKRRIRALNNFELGYMEFREKMYREALEDSIWIFTDPITLFLAVKRVYQRTLEFRKP